MQTKICTKCEIGKSVSEFSKHLECKFGVSPECKICKSKINKVYHDSVKDKVNEKRRIKRKPKLCKICKEEFIYIDLHNHYDFCSDDCYNKQQRIGKRNQYHENPKKYSKKTAQWQNNNPNKVKKYKQKSKINSVENLTDSYVIDVLRLVTKFQYSEIKECSELIEQKRQQMLLNRKLKEFKLKIRNHDASKQ